MADQVNEPVRDKVESNQKSADDTSYACKLSCEGNPIGKDDFTIKGTKSDKDPDLSVPGIIDCTPFEKNWEEKTVTSDQKFKDKIAPNEDSLIIRSPYEMPQADQKFKPPGGGYEQGGKAKNN